jgi:CheY-like chemotaxis protein
LRWRNERIFWPCDPSRLAVDYKKSTSGWEAQKESFEHIIDRVLVVDDYEPWRRFVLSALREQPQLQVVGQVSDGLEAVQHAERLQPDLIVLDLGLPILNGIEAAGRIRNVSRRPKSCSQAKTVLPILWKKL